jgi:hypothetical protein
MPKSNQHIAELQRQWETERNFLEQQVVLAKEEATLANARCREEETVKVIEAAAKSKREDAERRLLGTISNMRVSVAEDTAEKLEATCSYTYTIVDNIKIPVVAVNLFEPDVDGADNSTDWCDTNVFLQSDGCTTFQEREIFKRLMLRQAFKI